MIPLTRLNGGAVHLNADLIATVEAHHDTIVTLVDGTRINVAETPEQVVAAVVHFRALVRAEGALLLSAAAPGPVRLPETVEHRSQDRDARVLPLRPGTGG